MCNGISLVDDAEACKRRMNAASALIGGLGGEKERWTQQSKMFEAQLNKYVVWNLNDTLLIDMCRLVGDVLLATGFLSYSGPFNQEFRTILLDAWKKELTSRKIPYSPEINLTEMLTDAATVRLVMYRSTNIVLCYRLVNGIFKVYQMMTYQFKME